MMLPALFLALQLQLQPRLVIETAASELYIASLDGKILTKLTEGNRPVWSPDGTKIAFGLRINTPAKSDDIIPNVDLYVINSDGTMRTKVASNVQGYSYDWQWTADSKSLLYVKAGANNFDQAWLTRLGGPSRKLGPVCPSEMDYGTVSPCDSRIILWHAVGTWTPDDELDAKHHHELFSYGPSLIPKSMGAGIDCAFSPDGKWVAFDRNSNLMIARADGSNLKLRAKLEADEAGYCDYEWMPDSSGIVFVEAKTRNLCFMRPDGTGKRRLAAKTDAAWTAPRGSKVLAFTDSGTLLVDAQTGKSTRLYAPDSEYNPVGWSDDGTRLYLVHFTESGVTVRWHREDGRVGGEFSSKGATFDMDPLSPSGNVLVGSGEKGLTLFQPDGTPVRILEDTRVTRYSWSGR